MATTSTSRQQNRFASAFQVSATCLCQAPWLVRPGVLATLGNLGQPRLTFSDCFFMKEHEGFTWEWKKLAQQWSVHTLVWFFILNRQIEVISQLCIRLVTLFSPLLNHFSNSALQKLHVLGAKPLLSLTCIKASLIFTLITHKHEKAQWFWSPCLWQKILHFIICCLVWQHRIGLRLAKLPPQN